MSTRLYGGIRFHDQDFAVLHQKLVTTGVQLRHAAIGVLNMMLVKNAVKRADMAVLKNTGPRSFLTEAMVELMNKVMEANRTQRLSSLWFGFEISVMPFEGRLYGIMHGKPCDPDKFAAVGFDDFHYQDQTDPPIDMKEKDWAERERIWRGIFKDSPNWVPAEVAATFSLVPQTPEWDIGEKEDLKPILASLGKERFVELAAEILWDRALTDGEVFEGFRVAPPNGNPPIAQVLKAKNAFIAWQSTLVGQEALRKQEMDIASKLKSSVSLADIT